MNQYICTITKEDGSEIIQTACDHPMGENTIFTKKPNGYCFRTTNGKSVRISAHEYEAEWDLAASETSEWESKVIDNEPADKNEEDDNMAMHKIETANQAIEFINRNLTTGGQYLLDYYKNGGMDLEHEMWSLIRRCEQTGESARTELKRAMDQAVAFYKGTVNVEVEQAKAEVPGLEDAEAELLVNAKKASKTRKADKLPKAPRVKVAKAGSVELDLTDVKGNHFVLTALQADFLKALPGVNFWDNGVDSGLWIDVLCDDLADKGFGAMTVGAMISTLREKNILSVGEGKVNGHKVKSIEFTDLGKEVLRQLGIE